MFRLLGDVLSPAGPRGRLSVLIYHRMLAEPDPILHDETDVSKFEKHAAFLAAEFNVLPLHEAAARLARGALPARALAITFDDGYADNEWQALPVLKRFGLTATFFVSSGFSEGGIMFNDIVIESVRRAPEGAYDLGALGIGVRELSDAASRRAAIDAVLNAIKYRPGDERRRLAEKLVDTLRSTVPDRLMMTPEQIRHLYDEGMEIGCHTVSHPMLATLDDARADAEIRDCRRTLEEIIDAPVTTFAYPNGKPGTDYGPRDVELVRRAGFAAAVSTIAGIADRSSDLFQLPRFGPWESNVNRLGIRLLAGCMHRAPAAPHESALQ